MPHHRWGLAAGPQSARKLFRVGLSAARLLEHTQRGDFTQCYQVRSTGLDLRDRFAEAHSGHSRLLRPSLDSPYAARLPQDFLDFENAGEGRLPVGPFRADVASPWPLQWMAFCLPGSHHAGWGPKGYSRFGICSLQWALSSWCLVYLAGSLATNGHLLWAWKWCPRLWGCLCCLSSAGAEMISHELQCEAARVLRPPCIALAKGKTS